MNRKKTKFDPILLKEELNKFRLLSEYSFYTGESETKYDQEDDLILGNVEEADETPNDLEPADTTDATDAVADDLGVESPGNDSGEEETTGDIGDIEDVETDIDTTEPEPIEAPAEDEVEVDVTALVKGSEEAKQSADNASQNTSQLLVKFSELESKVAVMDNITKKIDTLEKEIVKRNPTPVEKMEMRSLNSYPYSLKLTDYWAEKEGTHDAIGETGKKEYILTKDDVNGSYSDTSVRQSFDVSNNDFTEEDM